MKPSLKYLLLLVPFLPLAFFLVPRISVVRSSITDTQFGFILFGLFIISVGSIVAYGWHMWNNIHMSRSSKLNWIFFFIFFTLGAQIAYWFSYIRHDDEQRTIG